MSPAEIKLRQSQEDWAAAMDDWAQAQERIRTAKSAWSAAQMEFIQTSACPEGCSGCPK